MAALLQIRDLAGYFRTYAGDLHALNSVDLDLEAGKITGLVGETGSGKTMTAMAILRLLPRGFVLTSGSIQFRGTDLLKLSEDGLRQVRGNRISMVFQDARAALNPVFTVGEQLERVARSHAPLSRKDARDRVVDLLARVQIPDPARRARQYAHELSGGLAQRVMIAMALIHSPELLILDEPTTGVDVTIQAEIMDLVRQLVRESELTALLITHDLGVVAEASDRVAVMYAGKIMEFGSAAAVFTRPEHPYTRELLRATLALESPIGELYSIPGSVPDLRKLPSGCVFESRCPDRAAICRDDPPVIRLANGQQARCYFAGDPAVVNVPSAHPSTGSG